MHGSCGCTVFVGERFLWVHGSCGCTVFVGARFFVGERFLWVHGSCSWVHGSCGQVRELVIIKPQEFLITPEFFTLLYLLVD